MGEKVFHYRWQWQLQSTPEQLWPLVADTDRFNRNVRLPPVRRRPGPAADTIRRALELTLFKLFPLRWDEEPFEWIYPQRFSVLRRYHSGPLAELRGTMEMAPAASVGGGASGGTVLTVQAWAKPRNLLGWLVIPLQIGLISGRKSGRVYQWYDRLAAAGDGLLSHPGEPPRLAAGGRDRLARGQVELAARGLPAELCQRLTTVLAQAHDLAVFSLRPYALADRWQLPRRQVLEACLEATRLGLLELSWNLLCPLCRGAAARDSTLDKVHRHAHCDSCHIDFEVQLDQSVEVTFRPTPAIRELKLDPFCVGSPQLTPHIVAQKLLPPGQSWPLALRLEPGRYRLRAAGKPGALYLQAHPAGPAQLRLHCGDEPWPGGELTMNSDVRLDLLSSAAGEQLLLLERTAYSDQATTAAQVIVLQKFRDLFAREALRPGQEISVGSLTILFTDLKGSTQMYRRIGDAPAFGRVMSHFDVLKEAIAAEGGSLVKTIGDAVMAVFRQPVQALRAVHQARCALAQGGAEEGEPLLLKAGVHYGPCIAVTLNERLDYFGTSVNLAARLVDQSTGTQSVVSAAVYHDPLVQQWLGESALAVESLPPVSLRGLDEPVALWRIAARQAVKP